MCKIKEVLFIEPENNGLFSLFERFESGIHICPYCHGKKEFHEEIGRDEYKTNKCTVCHGAGEIKAIITVKWVPCDETII